MDFSQIVASNISTIIIQWKVDRRTNERTDRQTDGKRCIRAHRAICTGGPSPKKESQFSMRAILALFFSQCMKSLVETFPYSGIWNFSIVLTKNLFLGINLISVQTVCADNDNFITPSDGEFQTNCASVDHLPQSNHVWYMPTG